VIDRLSKIPSGGKVLIRCKLLYTEDKNIYLDWKREDGRPMPRGSTVSDGTLVIQNLQKEDSGEYTCFGVDPYGKELFSAKSQLTVFGLYKKFFFLLNSLSPLVSTKNYPSITVY
jgi:hypothetical protein